MLMVSAQQFHCAVQDVGLLYLTACLWAIGIMDAQVVRLEGLGNSFPQQKQWPDLVEVLERLGVPQWIANSLPEDATVSAANQVLWAENAILVPRRQEALLQAGPEKKDV